MRRAHFWHCGALCALSLCMVGPALAQPLRVRLFDFEGGTQGWRSESRATTGMVGDAAFGQGCLSISLAGASQEARAASPDLPRDASWRKARWGGISLFLKGDGSQGNATLILETDGQGKAVYVHPVSLASESWHRVYLPFELFRGDTGTQLDGGRLRRISFAASGRHQFYVDELQLEATHREVPLVPVPTLAIPLVKGTPTLDGRLDEECWQHAIAAEPFTIMDGSGAAKAKTRCLLFHDGQRLYIGATLDVADASKLEAPKADAFKVSFSSDDSDLSYEVSVGPHGERAESSSSGQPMAGDWQAATGRGEGAWTVELSLPLAPLRARGEGSSFGLNLLRDNGVTGEQSGWVAGGARITRPHRLPDGEAVLAGSAPLLPLPAVAWNDYSGGVYAARLEPRYGSVTQWKITEDDVPMAQAPDPKAPAPPPLPGGPLALRATVHVGGKAVTASDSADPADRELFAPLNERLESEWDDRVQFALTRENGEPVAFQAFRYPVFMDPGPDTLRPSPLPILPTPKELKLAPGSLALPRQVGLATLGGQVDARVTRLLTRELGRWYGIEARGAGVWPATAAGGTPALLLVKHEKGKPLPPGSGISQALARRLESLPAEGYLLLVSPKRVVMAANDDAGLYYAAQTFLQDLELSTIGPDAPRARCVSIVDWPSLRWRALMLMLPTWRWAYPNDAPVDVDFFCDFIARFIARHKVNALAFVIDNGMKYDSHPEVSGPAAWSKEQMRRVVQTCRENFIEPIPVAHAGHGWFVVARKDLWEDGEPGGLACTSNPDTFNILTDTYAEILEAFKPARYFHIQMDEVWWHTLTLPPEQRCKLCAGTPKWQLYADQVKRLDDWFRQRGVRMMMFSDMLIPEHNGGAPYDLAKALPLIPKDVLQCNWSTTLAPDSDAMLHGHGFTVWQANSPAINAMQARSCEGNMFFFPVKLTWRTEGAVGGDSFYSYVNVPMAAEYSWNLNLDPKIVYPRLTLPWLQARESVLTHDALEPEPAASGKTFSIPLPVNLSTKASEPATPEHWFGAAPDADLRHLPRGKVTVEGTPFQIEDGALDCLAPVSGAVSIPVGRKAASVRFLHAARLTPGKEQAFFEGYKQAALWRGLPMGAYTITYEDGSTEQCPLLYIYNIRRWEEEEGEEAFPYIFRSVGYLYAATEKMLKGNAGTRVVNVTGMDTLRSTTEKVRTGDPDGKDICLYVAQWVNPRPEKVIRSIEVTGCPEAVPVVFAITGRAMR